MLSNMIIMRLRFQHTKVFFLFLAVCFTFLALSCRPQSNKNELTVYCAASLTEVITALSDTFMLNNNITVNLNFASSGTLARQIEMGAPADIFISANKKWMDRIVDQKLADTAFCVVANTLVLISNIHTSYKYLNLSAVQSETFAMGDPDFVPAGTYTKELLQNMNMWFPDRGLYAKDVKSALKLVELGEANLGFVYKTDALQSKKVKIVEEFSDSLHQPIRYYLAKTKDENTLSSDSFVSFITSEKGKAIFALFGFKPLD